MHLKPSRDQVAWDLESQDFVDVIFERRSAVVKVETMDETMLPRRPANKSRQS